MRKFVWSKCFCLLFLWSLFSTLYADVTALPEKLQVAFFSKIFSYSLPFQNISKLRILIVCEDTASREVQDLVNSFDALDYGIEVTSIHHQPLALQKKFQNADVAYFFQGTEKAASFCRRYHLLSITTCAEMVQNGSVSIALGIENHKPRIFINIATLEEEGQIFSGDLLQVAKIYRVRNVKDES